MAASSLLLTALCILLFVLQMFFHRHYSLEDRHSPLPASLLFSVISGIVCTLGVLLLSGFPTSSSMTVLLGVLNGMVLLLFKCAVVFSSRLGPLGFQSVMSTSGNILLPFAYSLIFVHLSPTAGQLVGLVLMLLALPAFQHRGLGISGTSRAYLGWTGLVFLSNGLYGILLDLQSRLCPGENMAMILWTYLSSTVLSLLLLPFVLRRDSERAFPRGKAIVFGMISGLFALLALALMMSLLNEIPGYLLYALINGGFMALSTLLSVCLEHDPFTRWTAIGLVCAVGGALCIGLM